MNTYGSSPLRILLDSSTRIAAVDGQLAADLGYDTADLLNSPFSTVIAPDDVEAVGRDLVALVEGDQSIVTSHRTLQMADETRLAAVLSAEARTTGAGFAGFAIAVLVDADQLSPPAALPDHLRRLSAPAAMIDTEATLLDTNLAWGQLFATAEAVTPGADLYQLVHDDDREELRTRVGELARGAVTSVRSEQRCLAESGTFWCRLSFTAFDTRSQLFTVTAEDISAEHLTNRVLLANEALFRSLAESSPVGLARLAPDLSITYASPSWREMTGARAETPYLDMASVLHRDGRQEALSEISERISSGGSGPVQARLAVDHDGPIWVSFRIGSVHDDELGTIGHVVTAEDVTERVSATESQLQLAGIVESTTDLVGIANLRTGEMEYLNNAAKVLFASDRTTHVAVVDIYGQANIDRYHDDIYPVLRRAEPWTGELTMYDEDGQELRVLQTITAEMGPDGEPERASIIGRDVSDERQALDEMAHKATHDALTGLPNRSLLVDHIELALARSERDRTPVAILFIDLDRFKTVNDTYGHAAGDELLREVATRMSEVLRPSDTVARLGGDEFVILCEDIDGEVDALTIADRVRSAIEDEPVAIGDVELHVSASIGIALSNGASTREPDTLLERADTAMYRAKDSGRARTELFDDVMRDRTTRRVERTEQLAQAIEEDALDVHYQPIVDLQTGRVTAVEAFVRWMHPASGLLGPSEFLPLAIEIGLGPDLDALVLHRACRDAQHWFDTLGESSPTMHVNISGATLMGGDLSGDIDSCLRSSSLPSHKLCMELSEGFLMGNGDSMVDRLDQIRQLGVGVAIDDVGTGPTLLTRLGHLRLDVLKIDGSLVAGILADRETRQVVRGVVSLAHALELQVGAESVEVAEAIPVLRDLGVDVAQGHVFSAALPAAKIDPLLVLRSTLARADR